MTDLDSLVIGAVVGAVVGSFLATCIIRWYRDESAVVGRSRCDGCAMVLRPWHLVPILSFSAARGRCRSCGHEIDLRHLFMEISCAVMGATALWISPGLDGIAGALFGWVLIALALTDLEHFWLPDRLVTGLALNGLFWGVIGTSPPLAERCVGLVLGYGSLSLIGQTYRHLRGKDGLGKGDPKLLGAIGANLGWSALPIIVFAAALLGLFWGLFAWWSGKSLSERERLPLGTLLACVAWGTWLIGPALADYTADPSAQTLLPRSFSEGTGQAKPSEYWLIHALAVDQSL